MTKNEKVTAGVFGGLVLLLGIGAYQLGNNTNRLEAPTTPTSSVLPSQPTPVASPVTVPVAQSAAPGAVPPRQWRSVAPGTPVGAGSAALVPGQTPAGQTTLVRTQSGALVPSTAALQAEQPNLAPSGQTTVSRTDVVAPAPYPAPYPASTVTTTRTTAYVPETTTETHRVYVHRRVRYRHHHSSGKVHVARAVKHTVMFTAKLPGRLRL